MTGPAYRLTQTLTYIGSGELTMPEDLPSAVSWNNRSKDDRVYFKNIPHIVF